MDIRVNGQSVLVVHIRHDGRPHIIHADDLGQFNGSQKEFLNLVESFLNLDLGTLNGYDLDIVMEDGNAEIHPKVKFG